MSQLRAIIAAVEARLGQIQRGNGSFRTDAGSNIYHGQEAFGPSDPHPLCSILVDGEDADAEDGLSSVRTLTISVLGQALADIDRPLDTELDLLEDLKAGLLPLSAWVDGRDRLEGAALSVALAGAQVQPRVMGGSMCEVRVDIAVRYQEARP